MPNILIIEDEAALLRGLKDNFEAQGWSVRTAGDGEIGLKTALDGGHDLIVLDLMLPKQNGYEICRAIRSRRMEMPILMLTAKGQEEDIVRGLELGADDYITKPFSIRELIARVRAFLRRSQSQTATSFRFRGFVLDLVRRQLLLDREEIILTAKEFRLLEFFVKRPGRAVTRDQILDAVWGSEIFVNDRSVDRCVTTLRAKIEEDPRHPKLLQTVRQIGYRFES